MSNWTANWRKGVLKRSAAYQAFIERDGEMQRKKRRGTNWKLEQIALLKKQRAIAARLSTRPDTISSEVTQSSRSITGSRHPANP